MPTRGLTWSCRTLVDERQRLRPWNVARLDPLDRESRILDERAHAAIEVTAADEPLPDGCEAVLPASHSGIRREPMFSEQQTAVRPQNAARFGESPFHIGDAAQRPRGH